MAELRVIIAEDDPGMRLVLRRLIEKEEGFVLAGEAENGLDAVRLAREVSPDVAFLDIEMPGADGLATARTLCAENEKLAIIHHMGAFGLDGKGLKALDAATDIRREIVLTLDT